jgi:hypothetical protein
MAAAVRIWKHGREIREAWWRRDDGEEKTKGGER